MSLARTPAVLSHPVPLPPRRLTVCPQQPEATVVCHSVRCVSLLWSEPPGSDLEASVPAVTPGPTCVSLTPFPAPPPPPPTSSPFPEHAGTSLPQGHQPPPGTLPASCRALLSRRPCREASPGQHASPARRQQPPRSPRFSPQRSSSPGSLRVPHTRFLACLPPLERKILQARVFVCRVRC